MCTGKDRGQTGKVLRAFPALSRVIVEGVNLQKRHEKVKGNTRQGGGIVSVAAPVHVSNVSLIDPKTKKPTRSRVSQSGKRVRSAAAKKTDEKK